MGDLAEVFVAPLDRLLAGVGEKGRRVDFLDREVAEIHLGGVHPGRSNAAAIPPPPDRFA
jgi:hypothetical protein